MANSSYTYIDFENLNNRLDFKFNKFFNYDFKNIKSIFDMQLLDCLVYQETKEPEFVVLTRGSAGTIKPFNSNEKISSNYIYISTNKKNINKDFFELIYNSKTIQEQLFALQWGGAGVKGLNFKDLSKVLFPLMPLEEQERTLPLVKAKIKILEDKIKELEEEKKANDFNHLLDKYLGEMLGIKIPKQFDFKDSLMLYKTNDILNDKLSINVVVGQLDYLKNTIYDITSIGKLLNNGSIIKIGDGSHNMSPKDKDLDNNGINYIQAGDIDVYGINYNKIKKVTLDYYNKVDKGFIEPNMICLAGMGTTGISCIYDAKTNGLTNRSTIAIKVNEKDINVQFLNYWFNSIYFNYQIAIDPSCGTRDLISMTKINKTKIVLPNIEKQKEIVEKLEKLLAYNPYWDNKIKEIQSIIDNDLNKYILNGYSDDLFEIPKEGDE